MKKIFLLIIALAFIVACSPVQQEAKEDAAKDVVEQAEPSVAMPEDQPEQQEPAEEVQIPEEAPKEDADSATPVFETANMVSDLLVRANDKVTSVAFTYNTNRYFVAWNKMRVDLDDFIKITKIVGTTRKDIWISSVFVDPSAEKALGYCDRAIELREGTSLKCVEYERFGEDVEMDFSEYYVKTPLNWLEEFTGKVPAEVDTQELQVKVGSGYKTSSPRLTFSEGGVTTKIYIEKFSGLPYMVEVIKDSQQTTYNYKDLVINTVKEGYVVKPSG